MNLLVKMFACCVLAMSALGPDPLLAAHAHVLSNDKVRLTISEAGALNSVENLLAAATYSFSSDITGVSVFSRGSDARLVSLTAWQMKSIWPELKEQEGR